jgi:glycoside hydrolase-like protein
VAYGKPTSVNRYDLTGDAVVTLAADYSFAHPKPEKFKTAGYDVVLRYLSHTPEKNLTHPEAKALREAGLSIGLVWETTADRALAGAGAAEEDRVDAEAMAAGVGYPKTCVIFYAVDKDVDPSDVNDYFARVATGATHPVGVYGSLRVCEGMRAAGHVTYLWQTEAWSGTEVSKHAHIYQRVHATKDLPANCDEDVVLKPLPLWAPAG